MGAACALHAELLRLVALWGAPLTAFMRELC